MDDCNPSSVRISSAVGTDVGLVSVNISGRGRFQDLDEFVAAILATKDREFSKTRVLLF